MWGGGFLPYDDYKIVLNCNCVITSNSDKVIVGNKHNAIVFYKNGNIVRLAVLLKNTNVKKCVENALNQTVQNVKLKDLLKIKNVSSKIVDLKQSPIFNKFNRQNETDIGSCDRLALLQNMLKGDYTESETSFGNYDCNDYEFHPDIEIEYELRTDNEHFTISHKGAFLNKINTRAIILQANSSLAKNDLQNFI